MFHGKAVAVNLATDCSVLLYRPALAGAAAAGHCGQTERSIRLEDLSPTQ